MSADEHEKTNNAAPQKHEHPEKSNLEVSRVEAPKLNQTFIDNTKLPRVKMEKQKEKKSSLNDNIAPKQAVT